MQMHTPITQLRQTARAKRLQLVSPCGLGLKKPVGPGYGMAHWVREPIGPGRQPRAGHGTIHLQKMLRPQRCTPNQLALIQLNLRQHLLRMLGQDAADPAVHIMTIRGKRSHMTITARRTKKATCQSGTEEVCTEQSTSGKSISGLPRRAYLRKSKE